MKYYQIRNIKLNEICGYEKTKKELKENGNTRRKENTSSSKHSDTD